MAKTAPRTVTTFTNSFITPPVLLRREPGGAHHGAELVVLAADERVGLRGAHEHGLGAELGEPLHDLLRFQRASHFRVDLGNDVWRRLGRCKEREPESGFA